MSRSGVRFPEAAPPLTWENHPRLRAEFDRVESTWCLAIKGCHSCAVVSDRSDAPPCPIAISNRTDSCLVALHPCFAAMAGVAAPRVYRSGCANFDAGSG
jgi:hypothetical protein